ncbi:hypothetical protein RI367_002754 [Sorochytrium milnesiophthora]
MVAESEQFARLDTDDTEHNRMSKSCQQCQRRKKKCDGLHPCARCRHLSDQCTYAAERKRGPKAKESTSPVLEPSSHTAHANHQQQQQQQRQQQQQQRQNESSVELVSETEWDGLLGTTSAFTPPDSKASSGTFIFGQVPDVGHSQRSLSGEIDGIIGGDVLMMDGPQASNGNGIDPMFMSLSGAVDERVAAAALGIDIDAVFKTFFRWFYFAAPVFTEEELRMYVRTNQLPDHTLYAMSALAAVFTGVPRSQTTIEMLVMPQVDHYIGKAHAQLMPRLAGPILPSIFEVFSLFLLGFQYFLRNMMPPGVMHLRMTVQALEAIVEPPDNMLRGPAPSSYQLSQVFWTLYLLDRLGMFMARDKRGVLLQLELYNRIPPFPQLVTSPMSPLDANVVFSAYVRSFTLLSRILLWLQEGTRGQTVCHEQMTALGLTPPRTADSVLTLMSDVSAFTGPSTFPPPYLITDPDFDVRSVTRHMTPHEANCWVAANLVYRLCTLYFETNAHRKWAAVELLAKVTGKFPLPFMSRALLVASETADTLTRAGHITPFESPACAPDVAASSPVSSTSPAATLAMFSTFSIASTTTTPLAAPASLTVALRYPRLETLVSWFEPLLEPSRLSFWWLQEDYVRMREIVNGWKQAIAVQQTTSAMLNQWATALDTTTATPATTTAGSSNAAMATITTEKGSGSGSVSFPF